MNGIRRLRKTARITQAELARRAGTSQPTLSAYETGARSPTLRTLTRLAGAVGLVPYVRFVRPMTREEARSLALHRAIVDRLEENPDEVLQRARRALDRMTEVHPHAHETLDEWRRLLELPVADLIDRVLDPSPRARELRHVTPFAGVLSAPERARVYCEFREEWSAE